MMAKMMLKRAGMVLSVMVVLVFGAMVFWWSYGYNGDKPQEAAPISETAQGEEEKDIYTKGDTFYFDGFDMVIGGISKYTETTAGLVVHLELTYTNVGSEPRLLNSLYVHTFGPDGVEQQNLAHSVEDTYGSVGRILPGSTVVTTIPVLYDGEGAYVIELKGFKDTVLWAIIL